MFQLVVWSFILTPLFLWDVCVPPSDWCLLWLTVHFLRPTTALVNQRMTVCLVPKGFREQYMDGNLTWYSMSYLTKLSWFSPDSIFSHPQVKMLTSFNFFLLFLFINDKVSSSSHQSHPPPPCTLLCLYKTVLTLPGGFGKLHRRGAHWPGSRSERVRSCCLCQAGKGAVTGAPRTWSQSAHLPLRLY